MLNTGLLNPSEFEIDEEHNKNEFETDEENDGTIACKRLMKKWSPELENQMLEAFIKLYYDEMYLQWGPDDEEESKEYWPKIKTPEDLVKHTGTSVTLYALEDAVYAKSKTDDGKYESQNVGVCVVLMLPCPWDDDHGWVAVFVDEKLVKVGCDIVDSVMLDD